MSEFFDGPDDALLGLRKCVKIRECDGAGSKRTSDVTLTGAFGGDGLTTLKSHGGRLYAGTMGFHTLQRMKRHDEQEETDGWMN